MKRFFVNIKTMENCIFCKIVNGEIPSTKVFEDENFLAFLDIRPVSAGHTLIIPKNTYNGCGTYRLAGRHHQI